MSSGGGGAGGQAGPTGTGGFGDGSGGAGGGATDAGALDLGPDVVPKADPDAGICYFVPGTNAPFDQSLVCFGTDPAPYQKYLQPGDAAVAPGQCPTTADFMPLRGEGSCGYPSCGPLLPSAVGDLPGAATNDAGTACCFLVMYACGV